MTFGSNNNGLLGNDNKHTGGSNSGLFFRIILFIFFETWKFFHIFFFFFFLKKIWNWKQMKYIFFPKGDVAIPTIVAALQGRRVRSIEFGTNHAVNFFVFLNDFLDFAF